MCTCDFGSFSPLKQQVLQNGCEIENPQNFKRVNFIMVTFDFYEHFYDRLHLYLSRPKCAVKRFRQNFGTNQNSNWVKRHLGTFDF